MIKSLALRGLSKLYEHRYAALIVGLFPLSQQRRCSKLFYGRIYAHKTVCLFLETLFRSSDTEPHEQVGVIEIIT